MASDHEHTIQDYDITAHNAAGQIFRFGNQLESCTYGEKGESKTVDGSGSRPRAHLRTKYKPSAELETTIDVATRFENFCGPDGVVRLVLTRQKPNDVPITNVVVAWKPTFDTAALKSGDAVLTKVTGNALNMRKDVKNVLTA
jgi:hypothetical protein